MPYNILIFIARKPTISHSEFKKHYECIHLPLLQLYGGKHFPKSHTRRYLQFGEDDQPMVMQGYKAAFNFDVIAEVGFDDEAAFKALIAMLKVEEVSKKIKEDEDRFCDREKLMVVVAGDVLQTKIQE